MTSTTPTPEGLDAVLVPRKWLEAVASYCPDKATRLGAKGYYEHPLAADFLASATADLERRLAVETRERDVLADHLAALAERNAGLEAAQQGAIGLFRAFVNGVGDRNVHDHLMTHADAAAWVTDAVKVFTEELAAISQPSQRSSGEVGT